MRLRLYHLPLVFVVLGGILGVAGAPPARAGVRSPQPGDVYREFKLVMSNASQTWRVTDPNASSPGAQDELPNAILGLPIPAGQLAGATRAELLIDFWGGHPGTTNPRFRFNQSAWLSVPDLTTTPLPATGDNRPECYMQQWNPVVTVPLGHLQEGANTLEGTSGGQSCFNFGWGQWGWFAVTLRVYFDPAQVANPTGTIVAPSAGATVGENPTLQVSASGGGGIDHVEFLAYADAYDWDGDGVYLDWGQSYHRDKTATDLAISHHAGTDESAPFQVTFNTELIPDQVPGALRFAARIKGSNGLWYVTPAVTNVTLVRTGSVFLARPQDVPPRFWVRVARPALSSTVTIPTSVNLGDISSAKLLVRTWNGVDGSGPGTHATKVNGWEIPGTYGANHHYSDDVLAVDPAVLVHGENTITFSSTSEHHGIEILWPGPALLLRTGGPVAAFCGDGSVDPGEQCDDGNAIDGDGCDTDCTFSGGGVCGDGSVDPGEQCDDGNVVSGDGCEADCTLPLAGTLLPALYPFSGSGSVVTDAAYNGNDGVLQNGAVRDAGGRFGAALRFDGNAGNVNLGPLNVAGSSATWAAFVKADDFGITDARILSKATSVFEQDHYFMISTLEQAGQRHFRFRLKTGGTTTTVVGTGATLTAGVWVHAAATYDGATLRLYQDGALVGSAPAAGTITGAAGVEVWIGDHVGGGKTFDGLIDEVLIDDRAYDEAEIAFLLDNTIEPVPGCGNGIVEPGEACDDGNLESGDGCQPDCEFPVCGDGFVDPGEECDDGNVSDGDGCQAACLSPVCGDGIVDPGEECDDANANDLDGCRNACALPACGDGVLDAGEECDDGNTADGDACRSDCILTFTAAVLPALYPFEELSAPVIDDSGNGNDGVLENGAQRDPAGRFGAALRFNGVAGNVSLGTLSVGGSAGTWAAYVKPDAFTIMDARILTKASAVAEQGHYFMLSTIAQGPAHHLRFRVKLAGVTRTLIGDAPLTVGAWVHVAATYDGSVMTLYQDGVPVGSLPATGALSGSSSVATWIGNHPGGGKTWNGLIDEVLIDDVAYSQEEVQAVMSATVALARCGDGQLDPGEGCDDGNLTDGDGCDSDCQFTPACGDGAVNQAAETCDPPGTPAGAPDECREDCTYCGDGVPDAAEACDDGNATDGDGCQTDCTVTPFCGDGMLNAPGETCDPPGTNSAQPDQCRDDCTYCGDGIVDAAEACDDGGNAGGDGCREDCTPEVCGDGIVDPAEGCDEGALNSDTEADACRTDCTPAACGDGVIDGGEGCDEGALNSDTAADACRTDCTAAACGDGVIDDGEECDDGNTASGDGCQAGCLVAICGDGWLDPGEFCDDGNQVDGDGCPGNCLEAPCGDGVVGPGEECDDGNQVDGDGCQADCRLPVCGDGILDPGEACDDANAVADDGCNNDCVVNYCGDGLVNAGERCDDGNAVDDDGCDTHCVGSVVLRAIQDPDARDTVRLEWTGDPVSYEVYRSTDAATLIDPANVLGATATATWSDTPPEGLLYFYRVRSLCGNATLDAGEACDDGNQRDGDGCQADCSLP